jgi:hypothetical protein
VNSDWQHAVREPLPDQGFEKQFRQSCMIGLPGWSISEEREMHLGFGLDTASGVCHEVDIVARYSGVTAVLEIKNRLGAPEKNDVVVFFAKVFDYLAFNPSLLLDDVCLIFLSNSSFELTGLAACMGLGINPVAPGLRPLPILIANAKIMESELRSITSTELHEHFQDFCAELNALSFTVRDTWLSNRCGYLSENTLILKAVSVPNTLTIAQQFQQLNADCASLLEDFRRAKAGAIA